MGPTSIGILALLITLQASAASQRVRRVLAPPDQIVSVKTAIGIATIIQVPDRPNSLVVGDTEAFKVEYLEQAITIKPLHAGAKSNLYIYTDYRRFNVQLVTGAEAAADYVVYLDSPKEKENFKQLPSSLRWTKFRASMTNDSISFGVNRIGRTKDGILIIEFSLRSPHREKFDPKWVWLTQNGATKPIHRLMLSRLDLDAKSANDGMVQIQRSDINETMPFRLELRRKKMSYLTIPEVTSWK